MKGPVTKTLKCVAQFQSYYLCFITSYFGKTGRELWF